MKKLDKAMKYLEDALTAASFAEEGDVDSARSVMKEDRRVLLAVRENQIDLNAFKYAVNTCKRIGASLDVLYISSKTVPDDALMAHLSDVSRQGIPYRLIRKTGCLKQQIIDYTTEKKNIIFAVTKSTEGLDVDCTGKSGKLSEAWRKLCCPLVVVEENA